VVTPMPPPATRRCLLARARGPNLRCPINRQQIATTLMASSTVCRLSPTPAGSCHRRGGNVSITDAGGVRGTIEMACVVNATRLHGTTNIRQRRPYREVGAPYPTAT
jgi:hypothetical protein